MSIAGFRTLFVISFVIFASVFAYPSGPGELDLSFAGAGYKYDGFGGGRDIAQKTVIQPDGKIVAAGFTSRDGSTFDVALARYNPDGTLDTTFNSNGKVVTPVVSGSDRVFSVAIQQNGKIVVAGYANNGSNNDFLIIRYNTNGTLDATFDGDGKVFTALSGDDQALDVAIQTDGKIVAAGISNNDSAIVRYNSNGSLDATFDGDGIVITSFLSGRGSANSVAVQTDGKIVTAGGSGLGAAVDFAMARYNADGSLDAAFDGDGIVTIPVLNSDDTARSLALQPDGKIVAAGGAYAGIGSDYDFAIVRCNTDGSLDTGFDGDGKLTATFQNGSEYASSVAVQPDGKIVAAGYTEGVSHADFAVLRLTADGSFDTSFDGDGKVITPIWAGDDTDIAYSVVLQSDGRILAAGNTQHGGDDFALVRYNTDGSLDTSFDVDGITTSDVGNGVAWGRDVVVQPDGKILTMVFAQLTYFALVRYNPDGTLDTSFGSGGKVSTFVLGGAAGEIKLQPDGKILIVGAAGFDSSRRIAVLRYNSDGSPDTTFDGDGMVTTAVFGGGPCAASSGAVRPDGKIVVTGYAYNFSQMAYHLAVVRYNQNGPLDTSFDGDGIATTAAVSALSGNSVVIQPDGKIVTGGTSGTSGGPSERFALARFNSNGSLDTSFDGDGIVTTTMLSGGSSILSLALLADGRIVAGGYTTTGSNYEFGIAMYNPNGSLDTSFDGDGRVITPVLHGNDLLNVIAIQSDGKIVAAGSAHNGVNTDMALVRYNLDGSLDSSYGSGGKAVFNLGLDDAVSGLALDASDKAVVVGSTNSFVTARITAGFSALVEVGGRVTAMNGQGISHAQVVLTDENNVSQYALTNGFGYYVFSVPSNEVYTVRASAKRYRIQSGPQTVVVTGPVWNVDFVANSGSLSGKAAPDGEKETITIDETSAEKRSPK